MAEPVNRRGSRGPGGGKRGAQSGADRRQRAPVSARIDSIAAGGEGVGRLDDGRVVFVHRTAPGDLAEIRLIHEQKRWARGRVLRILEPSPERREAPCRFYAECGGCTLEHITYEAQLRAKARIVSDAMTRIGGISTDPPRIVASPEVQRYRNRVSFALRRSGSGRLAAGFHALGDPERVIDVDGSCLLPEQPIALVWDRLRANWGANAQRLPSGAQLRLTLRATAAGEVSLLIEGGHSPGRPQELLDAVDGLVAIWHRPGTAGPELIAGAPGLPETWGDEPLELSGAAFLQVNRGAATLLESYVAEVAGPVAGLRVIDAYCGIGLHARRLARAGATVVGIELDPDAVAEARRTAPEGATFREGPVEELLPRHLPAELVILNPPRSGVAAEVMDTLATAAPHRIIYVSCNPAALARDVRRLGSSFQLERLQCFDLFPQTAHVETVALLTALEP